MSYSHETIRAAMCNLLRLGMGCGMPAQNDKLGTQRQKQESAPFESSSDLRVSVERALGAMLQRHGQETLVAIAVLSFRDFGRHEDWGQVVADRFGVSRATVYRMADRTIDRMCSYLSKGR